MTPKQWEKKLKKLRCARGIADRCNIAGTIPPKWVREILKDEELKAKAA